MDEHGIDGLRSALVDAQDWMGRLCVTGGEDEGVSMEAMRLNMRLREHSAPFIRGYLNRDGATCPICGSPDTKDSEIVIEAGAGSQLVRCSECRSRWIDYWELTDTEIVDVGIPRD